MKAAKTHEGDTVIKSPTMDIGDQDYISGLQTGIANMDDALTGTAFHYSKWAISLAPMDYLACDELFDGFVCDCVLPTKQRAFLKGYCWQARWLLGIAHYDRRVFLSVSARQTIVQGKTPVRIRVVWGRPTPKHSRGWDIKATEVDAAQLFLAPGPAIARMERDNTSTWLYYPHDDDSFYVLSHST